LTRDEHALAGQTLADRYDLLELIGSGGMGAVYRARDRELDELVALKVIRRELAADPAMLERFRREVKLARRVTHHNVARTFELGRAGDIVFCTMELVIGEPLTKRLARTPKLPQNEAAAIACAVCDALDAAHAAGVVHRDIKPDNVLIGDDKRVVLADFGVAALAAASGELSGTPAYMAPEQARGESPSPASDIYSVGVLLYEMMIGRRAFEGDPAKILGDKQLFERVEPPPGELPAELSRVISHATEREPASRTASAAQLRQELAPWSRDQHLPTEEAVPHARVSEEATVVVLSPHGDDARMYLAEAVYDELLGWLARAPRLRVLARAADDPEPGTVVARLEVGERLLARIVRAGEETTLEVPLGFAQVTTSAHAIAAAIVAAVALPAPAAGVADEAHDLCLQARHNILRDLKRSLLALDQIERAVQLQPTDPKIAAVLAFVLVRHAFFVSSAPPDTLARAAKAAQRALVAAPGLADAHLASGHVQLHLGNPVIAARHFRSAIARAPHHAEAHEYLGRMLLEAGYVEEALPRLEAAIAITPSRRHVRWEIARACVLAQDWAGYERIANEMNTRELDRPFVRMRMAGWRRDADAVRQIFHDRPELGQVFVPGMMQLVSEAIADGRWLEHKERVVALTRMPMHNHRRAALVAQLVAEVAGGSGDAETAAEIIERHLSIGLFDLHWLDRCPLLDGVRALPRFPELRAPIKKRAEAILDALYGEQDLGTSETAVAWGPTAPSLR
jgi:serine/threonine-protein kinase